MPKFEAVLEQAFELDTLDKLRLIEKVAPKIEEEVRNARPESARSHASLWGSCREMGPAPSAEDIQDARQEMLAGFPRDDVG